METSDKKPPGINPFEAVVVLVVAVFFAKSVYGLFYNWDTIQVKYAMSPIVNTSDVKKTGDQPGNENGEGLRRDPASENNKNTLNTLVFCNGTSPQSTFFSQTKFDGELCTLTQENKKISPLKVRITSPRGKEVNVKMEPKTKTFSSETVELITGANDFHIEYYYKAADSTGPELKTSRTFQIKRN
jgi:hypothetical protein